MQTESADSIPGPRTRGRRLLQASCCPATTRQNVRQVASAISTSRQPPVWQHHALISDKGLWRFILKAFPVTRGTSCRLRALSDDTDRSRRRGPAGDQIIPSATGRNRGYAARLRSTRSSAARKDAWGRSDPWQWQHIAAS